METQEAIHTRRSIRKFKTRPVEFYKIGRCIWAAMQAPTAGNIQDFRFMVVNNPDLKKGLAQAALEQYWMANAPVIIVIFSEWTKSKRFYGIRGERLYTIQDCAAAAQNLLLAAHDQGLGACWVGAFDEDKVCSVLGIPDYARPQALIPIGYPDEETPKPAKFKMYDMVFFNRWADNSGKSTNPSTEILKEWSPHVENFLKKTKSAVQGHGQTIGDKLADGAKNLFGKVKDKVNDRKKKK